MKKQISLAGLALASAAVAHTATAGQAIEQANNQLRLGYVKQTDFESKKIYADGLNPKVEGGSQDGFSLALSHQGTVWGIQNLYLSAELGYLTGDANYNGFDADTLQPLQEGHAYDYKSIDFAAKLGKGFALGQQAQFTPYVTAGYSFWRKDGEKSGEYLDELSNRFYGLGAMLQYAVTPQLVLTVDGSYARNGSSQTEWVRDGVTLKHDNKYTKQFGVGVSYSVNQQWSLFANWRLTERKFGVSGVESHGWHERASVTKSQQLHLGAAYQF